MRNEHFVKKLVPKVEYASIAHKNIGELPVYFKEYFYRLRQCSFYEKLLDLVNTISQLKGQRVILQIPLIDAGTPLL